MQLIESEAVHPQSDVLCWDGSEMLKTSTTDATYELPARAFSIFQTLSIEVKPDFEIRVKSCRPDKFNLLALRGNESGTSSAFSISVNIYGPCSSGDDVGEFLQRCRLYLQAPERCGYDVPYKNPHCLSLPEDAVIMTSAFNGGPCEDSIHQDHDEYGLFDELGNEEQFEEALQPELVRTALHRYDLYEIESSL